MNSRMPCFRRPRNYSRFSRQCQAPPADAPADNATCRSGTHVDQYTSNMESGTSGCHDKSSSVMVLERSCCAGPELSGSTKNMGGRRLETVANMTIKLSS
jgi:hypothetical protein